MRCLEKADEPPDGLVVRYDGPKTEEPPLPVKWPYICRDKARLAAITPMKNSALDQIATIAKTSEHAGQPGVVPDHKNALTAQIGCRDPQGRCSCYTKASGSMAALSVHLIGL